jgi:hypothetical protein
MIGNPAAMKWQEEFRRRKAEEAQKAQAEEAGAEKQVAVDRPA